MKPYIICHMMSSVDGRIDCAMTEQLPGVEEYYDALAALNAPSRVSGRVTAQLEMARPGVFESAARTPLGKEAFFRAAEAPGYEIVADTRGTLLWEAEDGGERMAVVGGGHINAAFLAAGLLDEVSVLVGAGIDGRGGQSAVFDGLPKAAGDAPAAFRRAAV